MNDDSNCDLVTVPEIENPLDLVQTQEMSTLIDPLRASDNYGIDIYMEVLSFVNSNCSTGLG